MGYETGAPRTSQESATVSGPKSLVSQVKLLRVLVDVTKASEPINRQFTILALDENDQPINGFTITPEQTTVFCRSPSAADTATWWSRWSRLDRSAMATA